MEQHAAIPKPRLIKAKTIDVDDMLIGISRAKLGLVGFFLPERVPRRGTPQYDAAKKRYDDRVKEYRTYKDDMKALEPPPYRRDRFSVIEQVIYGYHKDGKAYPLAGDNDMFDIRMLDGAPLPRNRYAQLIMQMMEEDFGVQHGATRCWITFTEGEAILKEDVIPKAAGTDIIRFRPHLEPRLVTSTTPVEPIDVAPGHAPGRRG